MLPASEGRGDNRGINTLLVLYLSPGRFNSLEQFGTCTCRECTLIPSVRWTTFSQVYSKLYLTNLDPCFATDVNKQLYNNMCTFFLETIMYKVIIKNYKIRMRVINYLDLKHVNPTPA